MSSIDIIQMALRNLFKRKLRTFLTVLGVVVGTGAIVIMISLGIAMSNSFNEQVQMMGDVTVITVYDPNYYGGSNSNSENALTKQSIEDIKKINGVKSLTPVIESNLYFSSGRYLASLSVKGIDVSVMEDFGYKLADGRLLNEIDQNSNNMVFGGEAVYQFYKASNSRSYFYYNDSEERKPPDVDVLNDKLQFSYDSSFGQKNPLDTGNKTKIKPMTAKGVGILQSGDWNYDYYVFMSITELEKIENKRIQFEQKENGTKPDKKKGYERVMVKCNSIDDVQQVQEEIKSLGYEAFSDIDSVNALQQMSGSLQALLGAIGGVSLFIAAIGITNTMIMAIYERTKEIGIMKVIGAQISDIKKLFLLEAILIGFMGGAIGVLISLGVSAILNHVGIPFMDYMGTGNMSEISTIPIWLCGLAMLFSSFVGLIAGYFPAVRAMKLSAIKAIRTE